LAPLLAEGTTLIERVDPDITLDGSPVGIAQPRPHISQRHSVKSLKNMEDFAFIPLGGTGEIGMNLNVYRCDGKLLAVDCGIGFGGPDNPTVEIMVPDPVWLADQRESLLGLVITHAHEDHVGAVVHLWPMLRCPVYAVPSCRPSCGGSWRRRGSATRSSWSRRRCRGASRSDPSTWSSCGSPIRCPRPAR
jgi:glyoxylase-like metal-dependent hydrolase (beta-lactamase superfamily II)